MEQKHARAAQNIVRTHPSFSKLTWSLRNSPGITTSSWTDTNRHKSRFRLYIVPRKRLGRVNSGESLQVTNSVLPLSRSAANIGMFLVQSFKETLQYCDEWRKFTSVIQSVIHSVKFPGGVPNSADVRNSEVD